MFLSDIYKYIMKYIIAVELLKNSLNLIVNTYLFKKLTILENFNIVEKFSAGLAVFLVFL